MESAISVVKGMNEDEDEACDRHCANGIDTSALNAIHHLHPATHQVVHILRLGTDEVNKLGEI